MEPRLNNGERIVSSASLTPTAVINLKWITELEDLKTIKLLEENTGNKLRDIFLAVIFRFDTKSINNWSKNEQK